MSNDNKLPFKPSSDQCNSTLKILIKHGDLNLSEVKFRPRVICIQPEIIFHTKEVKKAWENYKFKRSEETYAWWRGGESIISTTDALKDDK